LSRLGNNCIVFEVLPP